MPPRSPLCPHHRFNLKGTELQKSLVWKGPLEIISSPLSSAGRVLLPLQTRRAEGWMGLGWPRWPARHKFLARQANNIKTLSPAPAASP